MCEISSTRRPVANPQASLKIKGTSLDSVNGYEYFGHVLTNRGTGGKCITQMYRGLCARSNYILRNCRKCDNTKDYPYRSFCTSFYSKSIMSSFDQRSLNKLQLCYNNSLRTMMGTPRRCIASVPFLSTASLLSEAETQGRLWAAAEAPGHHPASLSKALSLVGVKCNRC